MFSICDKVKSLVTVRKENADVRRSRAKCRLRHASLFVNFKVSDPYTRPLPRHPILRIADCLVVSAMASMYVLKKERLGLPPTYHTIMSRLVPCEVTVHSQPLRLSRATSLCSELHSGPVASCMMSTTQETLSPVT